MLYFSNSGRDYIDPDKAFRAKDRQLATVMSDHKMEGYAERLKEFVDNQTKPKEEFVISKEEAAELNKLMDEVENA
jgi:predicted deacetylase